MNQGLGRRDINPLPSDFKHQRATNFHLLILKINATLSFKSSLACFKYVFWCNCGIIIKAWHSKCLILSNWRSFGVKTVRLHLRRFITVLEIVSRFRLNLGSPYFVLYYIMVFYSVIYSVIYDFIYVCIS